MRWQFFLAALMVGFLLIGAPFSRAEDKKPAEAKAAESEKRVAPAEGEAIKEVKPLKGSEDKPEFSASVDILTQYVFRGVAFSRGSAVFQPSLEVSFKGFMVNVWGNWDTLEKNPFGLTTPNRRKAKWNETDFTAAYSHTFFKNLTLTGGIIYYALDSNIAANDSFEIFGGVSYKFPWFEVGFQANKEVAYIPGWYLYWYVSKSIELPINLPSGKPSLDLHAGWSAELSGSKTAFPTSNGTFYQSLNAGTLLAALNIPVTKRVTVSPKIIYWYGLGGQSTFVLRNLSWDGKHNHVLGGASVSFSF